MHVENSALTFLKFYNFSCRNLYTKNIRILKTGGLIPKDYNVAENYKQYLNPLPNNFNVDDLTDDEVLMNVLAKILKRYLGK